MKFRAVSVLHDPVGHVLLVCVLAESVSLVAVHMLGWLGAQSDFLVNEAAKL